MISLIKPKVNTFVENAVQPFSQYWNPNIITISTLVFSSLTLFLLSQKEFFWGSISFVFFFLDLLDGAVARVHSKTTIFGGYLDAVCDRLSDGLLFLALGLSGAVSWPLCAATMLGALMVSYTKSKAETAISSKNLGTNELSIGYAERAERLIILFIVTFIYSFTKKEFFSINILEGGVFVLLILTVLTAVMRVMKTYEVLSKNQKKKF
jgi:archaetidylinositol phosphate synthase